VSGSELRESPLKALIEDRESLPQPLRSREFPPGNPSFGAPVGVPTPISGPMSTPTKKRKSLSLKDFRDTPSGTRTPNLLIKSCLRAFRSFSF